MKHALEFINDTSVENVILLQPTNPLRPENLLKVAFHFYIENNCDSLFTVSRNHQKLGKIRDDKFVPFNYEYGQRSQDLEPFYFENGLLYISKTAVILEDTIITENSFPYKVNHIFATIDIDTQEDFDYAVFVSEKHKL